MTRLADKTTVVTWTETRHVKVGYHLCPICDAWTPEPTHEELVEHARGIEPGRGLTPLDAMFMWPDADPEHHGWVPEGWHEDVVDEEPVLICQECHEAKQAALRKRRSGRKR